MRAPTVQNNGKGYIVLPGLNSPPVPLIRGAVASHFFGTRLFSEGEAPIPVAALGERGRSIQSRQVHGDHVLWAPDEIPKGNDLPIGDALITNQPGLLLAVSTADCVPVLLLDPRRKVIAAIHAGWRGTLLNISAKTAQEMILRAGCNPKDILAGIGPSIGPCCFQVGPEVWKQVRERFSYGGDTITPTCTPAFRGENGGTGPHQSGEKAMLDLALLNRLQLIEAGLQPDHLFSSGLCSSCFPNLFYSFRRDQKRMGHMVSGIILAPGSNA